ncbi:sensor histidine kinase [Streptomyces tagetis]|uniref:histidine kinase n=1 Tax=Streptomyces tagetis TaxID=2820809 RepID=A0A941B728_9ACTN|nr:histidine kinase [Streptomyces sp. RG38]MBQ0827008.1 sensor domain-containing protein [Streptomyces sp. RG38]
MWKATRQAARATGSLVMTSGMSSASALFLAPVLGVRLLARIKRRRVAAWTGRDIPEVYVPLTGTPWQRLRTAVRDPGTAADLRWLGAYLFYGSLAALTVPLWPLALAVDGVWCGVLRRRPVVLPLISRLAEVDARFSEALLKPSRKARLAVRVQELTQTRAGAIAAHGAELRRIERDLHDGTQARLVSLSVRIGLAKRAYDRDPEAARRLLDDAQDLVEEALAELRHVVRGIHPPILTDRGLVGAVGALAAGSGLDVTVEVDGLDEPGVRAPAAVEAAAYFVVAEMLTNAAKHGGCSRATVRLQRLRTGLRAVVWDEGVGGADETAGTGLSGIRRRVAALDGVATLTSPVGGPTTMTVELPCVW